MSSSGTVTLFACPYCGRTSEKQVCACRNTLYEHAGFYSSGNYFNYTQQIEQKRKCVSKLLAQQAERAAKTVSKASAFVDRESGKAKTTDARYDAEKICSEREFTIAYMRALVCAEGNVYSLRNIYTEVCKHLDNALVIQQYNAHVLNELLKGRSKSNAKPESPEANDDKIKTLTKALLQADGSVLPVEPIKPVLGAKKVKVPPQPQEPVYEKPGLFNRKRVEAENAEKKRTFEMAMEAYQLAVRQAKFYEKEKTRYDAEIKKYEVELAVYQKAFEEYEGKYRVAEESIRAQLIREQAEKEIVLKLEKKNSEKEIVRISTDAVRSFPHQKRVDYLLERKKDLESALAEAVGHRRALYAAGVVYEKYRTLVAEASMLEYLEARRCETLTGANGAYNLYESEIHAGIINPLLEQLLLSIETVKTSQTALFKELSRISDFIKAGNGKLNNALSALNVKTSNAVLAKQWLAKNEIEEIPLEGAAQTKLDAFSEFIKKQAAENEKMLCKLEQSVQKA